MKPMLRRLLIWTVIVLGSIQLTNFWGDYPDRFPAPLRWLGLRFVELFERRTPEETADLEQLFVLIVSLAVVSFAMWLIGVAVKRLR